MSAFIVTKTHIDHVVAAIMEIAVENGFVTETEDKEGWFRNRLGQWLVDMNIRAVDCRYGEHNPVPIYRNTYIGKHKTIAELVQRYKAIRCLAYQCCEGNVPETPLYRQLEAAGNTVARMILGSRSNGDPEADAAAIDRMPEYEDAPWGIDDPEPAPVAAKVLPAQDDATPPTKARKARKPRKPTVRKTTPAPEPADYYDHTLYATI